MQEIDDFVFVSGETMSKERTIANEDDYTELESDQTLGNDTTIENEKDIAIMGSDHTLGEDMGIVNEQEAAKPDEIESENNGLEKVYMLQYLDELPWLTTYYVVAQLLLNQSLECRKLKHLNHLVKI